MRLNFFRLQQRNVSGMKGGLVIGFECVLAASIGVVACSNVETRAHEAVA